MRSTRSRTSEARRSAAVRSTAPLTRRPAKPPLRVTCTCRVGCAGGGAPPGDDAPGVTPTVVHAVVTAPACSPADSTVACAKPAKSVAAPMPDVSAAYQIRPAPSAELPPMAVAAR